jgi:hypothetical protein
MTDSNNTPKKINLVYRNKLTQAFYWLRTSEHAEGAPLIGGGSPRAGNFHVMMKLLDAGLVECQPKGPKGGQRFFITPAGVDALEAIGYSPRKK